MVQLYQDALAICRAHGKIDFFITVTANPAWPKITQELLPGEHIANQPELTTLVFAQKKKAILDDIVKNGVLGQVAAHIYTIEFQKRGLPHMHLLIFLLGKDKIQEPLHVDSCIQAYWPDPQSEPLLFELFAVAWSTDLVDQQTQMHHVWLMGQLYWLKDRHLFG
jgi:hypothetical protein